MTNKEFTASLIKARKLAREHSELLHLIQEECEKRYGVAYNDVNEDWIIDSLDYGNGARLTYREFHSIMKKYINNPKHTNNLSQPNC